MSRDLDAALASEIAKPVLNPFMAVHIALGDPVRAWTGIGDLSFGGHSYLGTGALGAIGTIGESSDGAAIGLQVSLSGIAPQFGDYVLSQAYRGKLFELFVGALNESFTVVAAPPKLLWKGYVDGVALTDGEQLTVTITAESRMRDQGRPRIKRYTDQEQQRRYAGDKFFEYLPQLAELQIQWGRAG